MAEITQLDCSQPLSQNDVHRLKQLLDQYQILIIRGQSLTEKKQIDFTSIFGDPERSWDKKTTNKEFSLCANYK